MFYNHEVTVRIIIGYSSTLSHAQMDDPNVIPMSRGTFDFKIPKPLRRDSNVELLGFQFHLKG